MKDNAASIVIAVMVTAAVVIAGVLMWAIWQL